MQFHRYSSRFRSNHSVCVYEYYSIPTIISNTFDFKHTLHDATRTRRVLFTKLVCPFFFPSSPSDWLSMKRVIAWLWKKKEEREREKKRGENSPSVLYLSRVLCYPQFMRTRIPTIFIARVAYYSPFFHPLLFLCIDIDLSYRPCFCRGDCRRDTYSLEYRRRMWASERASEREREQFGPVFISMVSSSIRIAYKSW